MRRLTLLSLGLFLSTQACDCNRGRLVSANGGAVRVTLLGAAPEAVSLQIQLTHDGQKVEEQVPIATIPLVRVLDLPTPGTWQAHVTAWDRRPAAIQSAEVPDVPVVVGGMTEITIDFTTATVHPSESCNGKDDDGDGEVDEALDLPFCMSCTNGQTLGLDDDPRCGTIPCDLLDSYELRGDNSAAGESTCVALKHAPVTSSRCAGAGACVAPNGPACGTPAEQVAAQAGLCRVLVDCETGTPSVMTSPDGTPCGGGRTCQAGTCTSPDAGMADPYGCSDGTREGFTSLTAYPNIAACSGGWTVPGVTATTAPACGRHSGNGAANREGNGCSSADLCAGGWHVCRGKDEVALKANGSCADAVPPGTPSNTLFFAVVQHSVNNTQCDASGDNDVFGCGNLGVQLQTDKNCGVLTRALASTRPGTCGFNEAEPNLGPWQCLGGVQGDLHEGALVTKMGCSGGSCQWNGATVDNADKGGVLCCSD